MNAPPHPLPPSLASPHFFAFLFPLLKLDVCLGIAENQISWVVAAWNDDSQIHNISKLKIFILVTFSSVPFLKI